MIDIRELRIGNLVDETGDVTFIGKRTFRDWDELNLGDILKPIPLTEEWLIEFGFIEIDHSIKIYLYEGYAYNITSKLFFTSKDEDNETDTVNIRYVHQLQNLCFALTSEELKEDKYENKLK